MLVWEECGTFFLDNQFQTVLHDMTIIVLIIFVLNYFFPLFSQSESSSSGTPPTDANFGMITLYANGFTVGNGEFRDISDEKNKLFIEEMKNGDVPKEIDEMCRKEFGPNVNNVSYPKHIQIHRFYVILLNYLNT